MHLIGLKFYNIEMIVVENILIGRQMFIFFSCTSIFHVFIYRKTQRRENNNQLVYETQWAIQLVGEKKKSKCKMYCLSSRCMMCDWPSNGFQECASHNL